MTIARVRVNALDTEVSALGFGCASLGSRVAPSAGLAALERAYDAGVTWYDVAPSYGDGQAEVLLGRFLAARKRETVQVLTKVGIAPPKPSFQTKLLRPAMRLALAAVPGLRASIRRRRPAATKLPLHGGMILDSLNASLRRLGTDHVDVLALHDATPEEAAREDLMRALETAVSSGKARTVAIASSLEAAVAGANSSNIYGLAQIDNNLLTPKLARFRASSNRPITCVTHSVFGNEGAVARLAAFIERDGGWRASLEDAGYEGAPVIMAANLLADFAFTDNADGVVVVSMFAERHLRHNFARHARLRDPAVISALVAQFGIRSS